MTVYHGGFVEVVHPEIRRIISYDELIDRLKVRRLFDQILFHTETALALLAFTCSEEVSWEK